ncbi:Crp/Fnr family transcriptional regulator [Bradyrhizobium sp. 195]|uniref:Crp/Fnr family transcriptional regulator n=1 Tax=Bradyrhizobium sp. 195 TaxID=2782662 RepID=UPI002000DD39|nr:Crp/Fnr family transcriptional regulator [Bradyrhizobium sp. 195]
MAALPPDDFDLLAPHLQRMSFGPDAVLVRMEEQFEHVYFPISGVVAFLVEMSDGHTVASTLMGSEGAVGALSVLSSLRSPVTATAYVAGSALRIPSSKLKYAFEQSAAVKHVLRLHLGTQLLQLQNVAACNAVHPVECRMARWLLELHDRVAGDVIQLTQEALAQLLGVRRTTVTLTMNKLRGAGCIKPDRRGLLNIERTQLEGIACECYGVMRGRIDRMCSQELSCEAGGNGKVSMRPSEA